MQKFAIKIDLSTFFEDERKNVLILVDPTWNNVEHLQHRVEEIFDVRCVRFQTDEGYFLPPQESIEIVKFTHILKAFIPSEVLAEKRRKSQNKSKHEKEKASFTIEAVENHSADVIDTNLVTKQKKRKFSVLENGNTFASSTPNQGKRSKGNENQERIKQQILMNGHESLEKASKHNDEVQNKALMQKSNTNSYFTLNTNEVKKHVKSSKKKKHKSQKEHVEKICETLLSPMDISNISGTSFANNSAHSERAEVNRSSGKNKSRSIVNESHIHYNDAGEIVNNTTTATTQNENSCESEAEPEPRVKINFHCELMNSQANTSRVFVINTNKVSKNDASQVEHELTADVEMPDTTNILENVVITMGKSMSADAPNESATISLTNLEDLENNVAVDDEVADETQNQVVQEDHSVAHEGDELILNQALSMADDMRESLEMTTDQTRNSHTIDEHQESINETEITENESIADQRTNNFTQETLDATSEESNVIDLNESDEIYDNNNDDTQAHHTDTQNSFDGNISALSEKYTVKKLLPFSTPLTELPDVNDIVLFQVKHSKDLAISKFIAGSCQYVNKRTKNIKMYIIDDNGEMDRLSHRFIGNLDDSTDKKCINIKLPDMIDPKVFKIL